MARYSGPSCKICRREGSKLFLKGSRCSGGKCAFDRRVYAPGQHGKGGGRRSKQSNYGMQLREKQKVRKIYGIMEKQFRLYFKRASRVKGVTGHIPLQMLERRLDNVVFRSGFAVSRSRARQIVRHGLVFVNGRKVNIPSYQIKAKDAVNIRPKERIQKGIKEQIELTKERGIPDWLAVDQGSFKVEIKSVPERRHVQFPINEQLIVELYSK